jgi:hypothetical protein
MACCLELSTSFKEDFIGEVNSNVTIKLTGPAGAAAEIVHIRYAGEPVDDEAPYQFKIQPGAKMLVVLAEASKPGALLQLIEDCGGKEQVIDRFHFDPMNPARGYIVRGISS